MRVAACAFLQAKTSAFTFYSHRTISSSFGLPCGAIFSSFLPQKKTIQLNFFPGRFSFQNSPAYSVPSLKLYFIHRWPNYGRRGKCVGVASWNRTFASGAIVKSQNQSRIEQNSLVSEMFLDIRSNIMDLESKLANLAPRLSMSTITKIFRVLSSNRVLGLRFFDWTRSNFPKLRRNARLCSLMIDNFGRLDDFENMLIMMKDMSSENICLTSEAFGYFPISDLAESSLTESIENAVEMLNRVGGSCRNSGVYALIEMFSKLNMIDMAMYVVSITERKEAYFSRMIREKCRRDLVEDAFSLIREMEEAGISPRINVYNYILGNLCKNSRMDEVTGLVNRMKEAHVNPDGVTIEILINSACRSGKSNNIPPLLHQLECLGIEPRPETHLRFIRTMFANEEYEAVYKHVADSCVVCSRGSNMIYCLFAKLQLKKGDVLKASEVLVEMMEKRLKPDAYIYRKIVKQLLDIQRQDLARSIQSLYSRF